MKDQFVGDIGDYTKLGLLRVVENAGFSIGVNWYCTPPDGRSDGKIDGFLEKPCDTPDIILFNELRDIRKAHKIKAIEESNLLNNAKYYNEEIIGIRRKLWHEKALTHLCHQDIIFLDPDNGFEVGHINPNFPDGCKYATYDEAADYFCINNSSVIVYQHWRIPPEKSNNYRGYIERLHRIKKYLSEAKSIDVRLVCIKAAHRDYFLILQPDHNEKIAQAISDMLDTGWKNHMAYRKEINNSVFD